MPVSMLTMSSWVSTATATASSMRADSRVWRNVASPKITGTSSSAAADRIAVVSLRSITTTSCPAALQIGHHPDAERAEADDDHVVAQIRAPCVGRRLRPIRRDSSRSATKAITTAVVVTPANISRMPNSRSQVGWLTKLKSP